MDNNCLMQLPVVVYEATFIQARLQQEVSCTVDTMNIRRPYLGNDSFMQWVDLRGFTPQEYAPMG